MNEEQCIEFCNGYGELIKKVGANVGYEPMGSFAERHGSFEYVLHRRDRGFDRYVIVSFAPISDDRTGETFELEVSIGAEGATGRVRRRVVKPIRVNLEKADDVNKILDASVADALNQVDAMTREDIVEVTTLQYA